MARQRQDYSKDGQQGRPEHIPQPKGNKNRNKRIRQQSWAEIMWRLNAIRTYLENANYYPVSPGGKCQYCDAEPIFKLMELPMGPEFYGNLHIAPSGAYMVKLDEEVEAD